MRFPRPHVRPRSETCFRNDPSYMIYLRESVVSGNPEPSRTKADKGWRWRVPRVRSGCWVTSSDAVQLIGGRGGASLGGVLEATSESASPYMVKSGGDFPSFLIAGVSTHVSSVLRSLFPTAGVPRPDYNPTFPGPTYKIIRLHHTTITSQQTGVAPPQRTCRSNPGWKPYDAGRCSKMDHRGRCVQRFHNPFPLPRYLQCRVPLSIPVWLIRIELSQSRKRLVWPNPERLLVFPR